jgi:hypothetical protein
MRMPLVCRFLLRQGSAGLWNDGLALPLCFAAHTAAANFIYDFVHRSFDDDASWSLPV